MPHRRTPYIGPSSCLGGNRLAGVELEDRTIEQLPDRCQNCGATLTDAEKETALTDGPPSGLVLCTTCASEVVPVEEDAEPEADV